MSPTDSAPAAGVRTADLFIGGKSVPAEGGRYVETVEALTGEPIARVAAASTKDAARAADAAAAALAEWSGLPMRRGGGRCSSARRSCWGNGRRSCPP